MSSTTQRIALVTGANRGIGFEIARRLGAEGLTILLGVRDPEKGVEARRRLIDEGLNAYAVMLDVIDPITIQAAVGHIKDRFGRLDVLVNNAGIMIDGQSGILELGLRLFETPLKPMSLDRCCSVRPAFP